jgi:lysophospholipase L1-like esterase
VQIFSNEPPQRYAPVPRLTPANITILPLGDSITVGYWSSGPYNGYRLRLLNILTGTEPFWAIDQTSNPDAMFQKVTTIGPEQSGNFTENRHAGYAGELIHDIRARFRDIAPTLGAVPDAVLLMAGTNDVDQDYRVLRAPERLGSLIDDVLWRFPSAVVIVAMLTPVHKNETVARRKTAFNQALPAIIKARRDADWKVLSVNMTAAVLQSDMADQLHPMDPGYAHMAYEWMKGLAEAKELGWFDTKLPIKR